MTNHYVFEPQFCNPASGWVEPSRRHWFKPNGERGKSRKTFGIPDIASGNRCRTFLIWRR